MVLSERRLFAAVIALIALATLGHVWLPLEPSTLLSLMSQWGLPLQIVQHDFADRRLWLAIPNAADVLSNVPFAGLGLWCLALQLAQWRQLRRAPQGGLGDPAITPAQQVVLALFGLGLLATALGSARYHWAPSDSTLLWDRLGMTLAFAGVLGIAALERITQRSGVWSALVGVGAGAAALWLWRASGDVLPWSVYQFGGMGVLLVLACLPAHGKGLGISLAGIIGCYVLAKVCEAADHTIFQMTHQWVSGHTLKHLFAALAALPVLHVLRKRIQPSKEI